MLVVEVALAVAVIVAVFAVASVVRTGLILRRRVRSALNGRHRPLVQQVALATRLVGGGSPRVTVLRWRLARSVDGARVAVRLALDADAPVGDLPSLLSRVERLADGHDRALAALGPGRPDAAALARATDQVAALTAMAEQVRLGAVEALSTVAPDDATALAGDITTEVHALREGRRAAQL